MSIQKIFFSFILVGISLFFILNTIYFDKSSINKASFDFGKNYVGFSELVPDVKGFNLKEIEEKSKFDDKKIYVDNVNSIDKVYFSTSNYSKIVKDKSINFNLDSGIYLFELYDLSYDYTINDDGFVLKPKSPGKFFIDNRDQKDIKIFSFDSMIDLMLTGTSSQDKMTNVVLYPHMFFGFNSSRNKFLKNADLLRIESISRIYYVQENVLNDSKKLNIKFLNKIYQKNDINVFKFFQKVFNLVYSDEEYKKYDISNLNIYKSKDLPGLNYINKYFLLFLNNEKKEVYYKKNIINNLNKFFSTQNNSQELTSLKTDIMGDLQELKLLNSKDFNDFKEILLFYYKNLLKINSVDYIDSVFLLSDIISETYDSKNTNVLSKSSFYLNKIYSLDDNENHDDYLKTNMLNYLNYFLDENQIKIKDNDLVIKNNKETIQRLDYLSFFLKNILIYNFNISDGKKLDNILDVAKIYFNINQNIVNFNKDNTSKNETLILEYSDILKKVLDEMRNNLFKRDLSDRGLLVLNNAYSLSSTIVDKFNKTINLFFNFYSNNKSSLSEKNQIYNQTYFEYKNIYDEYYSAINNYNDYSIKYDKTKNDLFNTKTILENEGDIVLNQENLYKYLQNFDGIDYSNISVQVFGDYYKVDNLYINGEKFGFNLYPKEFNTIREIYRNGEKLSLSYELNTLKQEWDEQFKNADEEQRDKYDFKRFFINTFFATKQVTQKIEEIKEVELKEDKTIVLFKRDKLLGEKGDFSVLKGTLDIKYNDVIVNLVNNIYNTKIQKSLLTTTIEKNGEIKSVYGILTGDYVFSNTDHYFKNISIKFYNSDYYLMGEEVFLNGGKSFIINKNINVLDFNKTINQEVQNIFSTNNMQ